MKKSSAISDKKNKKLTLSGIAERFYLLFSGNNRSVGRYNPVTGKAITEDRPPAVSDFVEHIKGTMGVGVVPIRDDATVTWAALDIDNHDDGEDIPIVPLEAKSNLLGLPLTMCRSKSGGVHAYVFFSSPLPAVRVREIMHDWSGKLGHAGCEIFPKQNKLHRQASGALSFGNWINLPYMAGDETTRYAVHNGKKIGLMEFLDLAESRKVSMADIARVVTSQYADAPPCIARILAGGAVQEGNRNEVLFNTTIYLRKAHPEDFAKRAAELNPIIFSKPLGKSELLRTITSAGRPDYSYRCSEEPMRSYCDKVACVAGKWGITAKDAEGLELMQELPAFSDLVKYSTDPVRWEITIGGKKVSNLSTSQLLDWRFMREMIAERLLRVVPMIKPSEWERILSPLMGNVRLVEAPDDASVSGIMRAKLKEFAAKTDLMSKGQNIDDRKAMLRGLPCVQEIGGERCVVFRGQDFVSYLKRVRAEELKGVNLWFAVKDMGVMQTKMRVGDHSINVWYIPIDIIMQDWEGAEAPEFTSSI